MSSNSSSVGRCFVLISIVFLPQKEKRGEPTLSQYLHLQLSYHHGSPKQQGSEVSARHFCL